MSDPGKKIYLLEMDQGEWVWCDDPKPDLCADRRVIEYQMVRELPLNYTENEDL